MSSQATCSALKKLAVTNCSSVFSFEWRIEHYYPQQYLSEDFCHPIFPNDLWFIRLDPPNVSCTKSDATVTIVPKTYVASEIAITLQWNDTIIFRTKVRSPVQAMSVKHAINGGYESLIGSTICVRCNLYYPEQLVPQKALPSSLASDLMSFIADSSKLQSTADFKLISSDGVNFVQAHRLILASRSPYFRAMLSMDSDEKRKGSVHLKSTPIAVLNNLLPLVHDEPKNLETLSLTDAVDLFKFADQYDFPHIKLILECHLATRLSTESLPLIEQLISHVDSEILTRAVANFHFK